MERQVSSQTVYGVREPTVAGVLRQLQNTYCRSIGVQFMHIDDRGAKRWLIDRLENPARHRRLSAGEQLRILTKLTDAEIFEQFERFVTLTTIDSAWKDHLYSLDRVREGIGLRAYGQKNPLVEYKRESFEMFGQMQERIQNEVVRFLFLLEPMTDEERQREEERRRREQEAFGAIGLGGREWFS